MHTFTHTNRPSPSRFGRYLLLARLGAGGMAIVHRAVHRGSVSRESSVALKRVRGDLHGSPEILQMFVDEARIASRLSHPNLGRVLEMGCEGHVYYQTMEYLPGVDLHRLLRADGQRWALPIELAAFVGLSLAEGLEHVHRLADEDGLPMKIVHRDVNPKNVRLTFEGRVVLLDFGVARSRHRLTSTDTGMVKGKLAYLAPEQLAKGAVLDGRTDLFALGITLYEMVTGRHPFSERDVQKMFERMRARGYAPIGELCPDAPRQLVRVIERALEPDPEERWQTAGEIAFELRRCLRRCRPQPDAATLARLLEVSFPEEHRAAREEDEGIDDLLEAIARGEIEVCEDEDARACDPLEVDVALDGSEDVPDPSELDTEQVPLETIYTSFEVDLGAMGACAIEAPAIHTSFDIDLSSMEALEASTAVRAIDPSLLEANLDPAVHHEHDEALTCCWERSARAPDVIGARAGPGGESLSSAIEGWLRSRGGEHARVEGDADGSWRALRSEERSAWIEPGARSLGELSRASARDDRPHGERSIAVGRNARFRVRA